MFHGFDPATRDQVFARRNKRSLLIAALSYAVLFGSWVALDRSKEPTVEVQFEPEIKDFAIEEEPEPEPEEEPPPPPPPELQPKPQVQKPKPKPKPEVPKVIPDAPPPEQDRPADDKAFGTGPAGAGTGPAKPKPEVKKPEVKKPDPPKPPPPKPAAEPIDPTKPIDRPEKATVPQADPGNKPPDYPKDLRDAGVEGEVVVKIHVHRDGTVKGAKILRSSNSATGEEEKAAADKAFKAAAIAAIKAWKFTPSKLDGEPISIWLMFTFPFKLSAG